ncbi:phosphate ABC transporter permease PstA [Lentisphaera profundi]|uniref:Phosphate transport system permease protein PstA n=1 Tax=Lentisphaera profundi TaxID=1658616 RepID=A0ABY7VYI5_9BACT|nr:phosphate ABC transporter permease PstA [Lentisphaera profundi]WDE97123.1 phosphate ABC transporter permease PstA [Lentisphaera profundi]
MEKQKTIGEAKVWLAGLGLTFGLAMTVSILALIIYYGLGVFWPKDVITANVPVSLAIEDKQGIKSQKFLGIEVKRVEQQLPGKQTGPAPVSVQFYTANRDAYGSTFVFIPEKDLTIETERNPKVMLIERETDSRAMVIPLELTADGKVFDIDDANFQTQFDAALETADKKRKQAEHIIHGDLRQLSHTLKKLKVEVYVNERDGVDTTELLTEIETLKKLADQKSTEVNLILKEQNKDNLKVQVSGGMTYDLSIGNIIRYNFPNQLTTMGKLALFFDNIYEYVTASPREANTEGGIFPAIVGTLVMTIIMCIPVTFFGVITAIYLHEYAKESLLTRSIRIAINNLAGVPSIVFGAFGLGFLIYVVGVRVDELFFSDWKAATGEPVFGGGGLLWASLTLALMTLPVVIVSTEEALASVPSGLREGAMGCGATKWQSIWTIILPSATPGIITGMILAMARGAGEVAPLMLVGVIKVVHALPVDFTAPFVHLDQKFMHLGFHIYDLGFQSPDSEAAKPMVYATTLFLILTVTVLNLTGIIIRQRLKKRYASTAF